MRISAFRYYLDSLLNLIRYTDFYKVARLLFTKPVKIKILSYEFYIWNLMDLWTIKEVVIEKCYQIPQIVINKRERETLLLI